MPIESGKPPGAPRPKPHRIADSDFAAVIRDYLRSDDFLLGLAESSQGLYRRILRLAARADTLGALSIHVIRPALVQGFLDGLAATPGNQKNARAVLCAVEKWAIVRDRLPMPITLGTYTVDGDDSGHEPWPDAWIDLALRHARPDLARVVMLAFHTGQRGSDIVRMRFSDIAEHSHPMTGERHVGITVEGTQKVGLHLWIPCDPELRAALAGWTRVPPFFMVLNPHSAGPYTRENLSWHWNKERARNPHLAPLEEGQAVLHGLRASCVIRLRMRGATTLQISSMIGMSLPMVERYSRLADQRVMAMAAVHHLNFDTSRDGDRGAAGTAGEQPKPRRPKSGG